MEKINLYINSKNRDNDDDINHNNISLPNGLLCCNADENFILNVNIFIPALTGIIAPIKIINVK